MESLTECARLVGIWLQGHNDALTEDHHRAAIRTTTFTVMEDNELMTHTCIHRRDHVKSSFTPSLENTEEIESEDPEIIEFFENLVSEFTETLLGIDGESVTDPQTVYAFWSDTWPRRTKEAIDTLFSGRMSEADIRAAESIGVAWVEELKDGESKSDGYWPKKGEELSWFRQKLDEI